MSGGGHTARCKRLVLHKFCTIIIAIIIIAIIIIIISSNVFVEQAQLILIIGPEKCLLDKLPLVPLPLSFPFSLPPAIS